VKDVEEEELISFLVVLLVGSSSHFPIPSSGNSLASNEDASFQRLFCFAFLSLSLVHYYTDKPQVFVTSQHEKSRRDKEEEGRGERQSSRVRRASFEVLRQPAVPADTKNNPGPRFLCSSPREGEAGRGQRGKKRHTRHGESSQQAAAALCFWWTALLLREIILPIIKP